MVFDAWSLLDVAKYSTKEQWDRTNRESRISSRARIRATFDRPVKREGIPGRT